MSGARDTGGSAFPTSTTVYDQFRGTPSAATVNGMTLRDYFAGQVVGHMCADPTITRHLKPTTPEDVSGALARLAYAVADAMLKERSK